MPLQLALQGGGARLIALLAAMEAVEELNSKEIEITRLSGTSAGAIAACLFAAGISMQAARALLVERFTGRISTHFPLPGNLAFGWHAYRRKAIWSSAEVGKVLTELFHAKRVHLMGDLAIPTAIVASNLTTSAPVVYRSWSPSSQGIAVVHALLDSIALPFFFRVWNDNGNPVHVDGGICSNLPSSVLLDDDETLSTADRARRGKVFALSFPPSGAITIKSAKDFAYALIGTAIDSAIQREKSRLGSQVHEIQTSLTTLDFEQALQLSPIEAGDIKRLAAEFFHRQAKSSAGQRSILDDLWKEQNIPLLESLWRIYQGQQAGSTIEHRHCRIVWLARGLADQDSSDDVHFRMTFKPAGARLRAQSIGLLQQGASDLGKIEYSVFDSAGEPVQFETLPARDPDNPLSRQLLFHYLPPLPIESEPYELHFREELRHFSRELRETGRTEFYYTPNRVEDKVGAIELIIQVPEQIKFNFTFLPGCEAGKVLKPAELVDFLAPTGYRSYGWRVVNWPAHSRFGVTLRLADAPGG